MFESVTLEPQAILFASIGVIVVWAKMGRKKLRVYGLSRLVDQFGLSKRMQMVTEFLIFVSIGVTVAIGVVQPSTATQALAAGMGWTGLLAHPSSS